MAFYKSFAPYYDLVFPLNYKQVDFVLEALVEVETSNILDVGCGTGNLTVALSKMCKSIIGVDLDADMLKIAHTKSFSENISFNEGSMLALRDNFNDNEFDAIVCFGNTLVHLENIEDVESFIKQCHGLLKPGGKLLIQIINYDRILDDEIDGLPTIENSEIRFTRHYNYMAESNEMNFITEFLHKKECVLIENEQLLFPIRKQELNNCISSNGFKLTGKFGGFDRQVIENGSIPYIIEAVKQ